MSEPLTCDRCTDKGNCPEYKAGAVYVIERKDGQPKTPNPSRPA